MGDDDWPYSAPTQMTWTPDRGQFTREAHTTTYNFVSTETQGTATIEHTTSSTVMVETACTAAGQDFKDTALKLTNEHRANHTADPLTWDDDLACAAQRQVDTCNLDHQTFIGGRGYGQNIAGGMDVAASVDSWYGEYVQFEGKYGMQDPPVDKNPDGSDKEWGHFTATVWAYCTSIGCATKMCDNEYGGYITCNYYGTGTVAGFYGVYVLPPTSSA